MKLTNIQDKIAHSIHFSINSECIDKTYNSIFRKKIYNEIRIPNRVSIENIQRTILINLQNEIN